MKLPLNNSNQIKYNILLSLSRSISVGIVNSLASMAFAFTNKTFPTLVAQLNFHGAFYVYGSIALILTIWGIVTMKITDGLSLVETERLYNSRATMNYGARGASRDESSL